MKALSRKIPLDKVQYRTGDPVEIPAITLNASASIGQVSLIQGTKHIVMSEHQANELLAQLKEILE